MGRERVVALVGVSALAAVIAGTAMVVAGGDGGEPRPLPIGGASASARSAGVAEDADMTIGGVEYRLVGDLPSLDGEAHAWRLRSGTVSDEAVRALGRAVGVDGDPERADGYVTLRDGDRQIQVWDGPGASWWFSPVVEVDEGDVEDGVEGGGGPAVDVPAAEKEVEAARRAAGSSSMVSSGSSGSSISSEACPPDADCDVDRPLERPADLPGEGEAKRIALRLFAATGLDVDQADVRIDDGITSWWVTAAPRIGGLPVVGLEWTATIGPRGEVLGASGWLAAPDREDRYPLVSTGEAYDRLVETGGGWYPFPTRGDRVAIAVDDVGEGNVGGGSDGDEPVSSDATPGTEPATDPVAPAVGDGTSGSTGSGDGDVEGDVDREAGEAVDPGMACADCRPEPYVIEVTGAHLGLLAVGDYLVPAVVFESSAGDLPVIALHEEHVVVPEPEPVPSPLPAPDPSGGGCAAADVDRGPAIEACVTVDGRDVSLTLSAIDDDAAVRDDCGSPVVSWGDDDGTAVCELACVPGSGSATAARAIKGAYEHRYDRAGSYTVEVTVESNCGETPGGRNTLTLDVEVG